MSFFEYGTFVTRDRKADFDKIEKQIYYCMNSHTSLITVTDVSHRINRKCGRNTSLIINCVMQENLDKR